MKSLRTMGWIATPLLFGLVSAGPAKASTINTYTYTGNQFTEVSPDPNPYFTLEDRVSGYMTIDCGLLPQGNGSCTSISPPLRISIFDNPEAMIDYEFSAGALRSNPSITEVFFIALSTDASGAIVMGEVSIGAEDAPWVISTNRIRDQASLQLYPIQDRAISLDVPGSWTTEIIPIPAALYLFPSGLLALLALTWWRRPTSA